MNPLVMLALTGGIATTCCMFFEWETLMTICGGATLVLGVLGFFNPIDKEQADHIPPKMKNNARLTAIFSVVLAVLPVFKPMFDEMAYERAEKLRAIETAPMYAKFKTAKQSLQTNITDFYDSYGVYPAVDESGELLPMVGTDSTLLDLDQTAFTATPQDPFDNGRQLTIFPLGQEGVLFMSVGQDGDYELAPLKKILPIDGEPKDPLAPLAAAGLDFRPRLYDPTNGSLSTGDLMDFVSADESKTRDEVLAPLFDAWKYVDSVSPKPPRNLEEDDSWPPAEDDAQTAEDLIQDEEWLGALAASSRAVLQRRIHKNFWKTKPLQRAEFNKGRALYELGHYRFAADTFNNFLKDYPVDVEGHYWLGMTYWLGGREDLALHHLNAAYQFDPNHPDAPKAQAVYEQIKADQQPNLPLPMVIEKQREEDGEAEK